MTQRASWKVPTLGLLLLSANLGAVREASAAPSAAPAALSEKEVAGRASKLAAAEKASLGAKDAATKAQERIGALNEVKGHKVVRYFSGAPYVDPACHSEFPAGTPSGMTSAMRAEWKTVAPTLRAFVCGF